MSVMSGWQFQCANTTCLPIATAIGSSIRNCQISCLAQVQCQAISFHQSTSTCELFTDISNQINNMLANTDIVTMIVMAETRIPPQSTTLPTTATSSSVTTSLSRTSSITTPSTTTSSSRPSTITSSSTTSSTTTSSTKTSSSTTSSTTTSSTTTSSSTTSSITSFNLLINGDAETGPCESGSGITHPKVWTYSGTITQAYYNNTYVDLMFTDPGPSNRGRCYFYGQTSATTTMWQTVNMTNTISPLLIDSQSVWFNFSAWVGGYLDQDDNAQVSLTFLDQVNEQVGNSTTLGPVFAADRGSITSLLFRQANGLVPIGARSCIVLVTITLSSGTSNDGDIDSIAFFLYQ